MQCYYKAILILVQFCSNSFHIVYVPISLNIFGKWIYLFKIVHIMKPYVKLKKKSKKIEKPLL